jgi:eukaryotic-like serine/threonine-protein kinase
MLRCRDVTRGGMFLLADDGFPPVFTRLKVAVVLPDGELGLNVEVVRHVTAEQSRAWNMPVGFGVQFVDLTQAQRDDVADLAQGRPRGSSGLHRPPEKDDPRTEEVLSKFRSRSGANHYDFLGVFEDADFAEVRQRVRDAKKLLVDLRARGVSARQRDQLDALEKKLDEVLLTIGQPRNRLDYDAQRGNWKGAARCIASGVSVTDLDNARQRYLAGKERVEGTARLHFTTGSAWESQKDFTRAQQEFEHALTLDPLNLAFHQRYQALKRAMNAPPPPSRRR